MSSAPRTGRPTNPRAPRRPPLGAIDGTAWVLPAYVVLAVVLGGASAAGLAANLLVELAGLALIARGALRQHRPWTAAERRLAAIGIAFAGVALLQLIPLPPAFWASLPARAPVAAGFRLLDVPLPWLPISLDPAATLRSLVFLCGVAGALAATMAVTEAGLVVLGWTIVGMASLSVVVGFVQLASGGGSPLYFYAITNRDQPVGFFANSNHLATLELMAMPFIAALGATMLSRGDARRHAGILVALATATVLILLGIVFDGSIAGLALLVPALIASSLLFGKVAARPVRFALLGAIAVLLALFVALALNSPIVSGFAQTAAFAGPTSRLAFARGALAAGAASFPWGTGLGSFVSFYPSFEDPNRVSSIFVNHVHDDYLELVVELGLAAIVLIAAMLAWWGWRVREIWRDPTSNACVRAATISTGLVLAHSLVDYPMRTASIAVVFTVCAGLIARPSRDPPPPIAQDLPAPRHLSA